MRALLQPPLSKMMAASAAYLPVDFHFILLAMRCRGRREAADDGASRRRFVLSRHAISIWRCERLLANTSVLPERELLLSRKIFFLITMIPSLYRAISCLRPDSTPLSRCRGLRPTAEREP